MRQRHQRCCHSRDRHSTYIIMLRERGRTASESFTRMRIRFKGEWCLKHDVVFFFFFCIAVLPKWRCSLCQVSQIVHGRRSFLQHWQGGETHPVDDLLIAFTLTFASQFSSRYNFRHLTLRRCFTWIFHSSPTNVEEAEIPFIDADLTNRHLLIHSRDLLNYTFPQEQKVEWLAVLTVDQTIVWPGKHLLYSPFRKINWAANFSSCNMLSSFKQRCTWERVGNRFVDISTM